MISYIFINYLAWNDGLWNLGQYRDFELPSTVASTLNYLCIFLLFILGPTKRRLSGDSEQPLSPSILPNKMSKVSKTTNHPPDCSHCLAIKKEEKDSRNDLFCLLLKEEMNNIQPCMRGRVYSRILFFLHSLEGKHSTEIPLVDSELNES